MWRRTWEYVKSTSWMDRSTAKTTLIRSLFLNLIVKQILFLEIMLQTQDTYRIDKSFHRSITINSPPAPPFIRNHINDTERD